MTLSIREAAVTYMGEVPEREKPMNRLLDYGAGALSTAELLAALFGNNRSAIVDAEHVLDKFGGLPGLAKATPTEIQEVHHFGPARVAQIKAALELGRRLLVAAPGENPRMRSPSDIANMLMPEMSLLEQEHLCVVLLDTHSRVLGINTLYIGTIDHADIRIGEVFRHAIRTNAAVLVIAHNHPSGDPTPSPDDVRVTREIVEAGKLLGIDVLDHLVIGRQRFVSLKERGLGFN